MSRSPGSFSRSPTRPATRSAAARVAGGSAFTTLLRSVPSDSKSVRTRPSAPSTPQWVSIRNRRMPSSSWRWMVRLWLAISQPGLSAAENELWVPAKIASFSLRSQRSTDPLQPVRGQRLRLGILGAVEDDEQRDRDGDHDRHPGRGGDREAAAAPVLRAHLPLRIRRLQHRQQLGGSEEDEVAADEKGGEVQRQLRRERDDEAGDDRQQRAADPARRGLGTPRDALPQAGGRVLELLGIERGRRRCDHEPGEAEHRAPPEEIPEERVEHSADGSSHLIVGELV